MPAVQPAEPVAAVLTIRRLPLFSIASLLLLALLFVANVYRAATQSITIDEAFTYNHLLTKGHDFATEASPFNDTLNASLARISIRALGASEFSMRLPSVLGGLLYFVALFLLCRLLFGESGWLLAAVSLNALNPFLLDYLSAARGYGMALAFWTLGAYALARWLMEEGTDDATLATAAGIAFGLAIASHLTESFAVAAIVAAFAALGLLEQRSIRFITRQLAPMCEATIIVAGVILWEPLHRVRVEFIDGVVPRYKDGLKSLVSAFALYKTTLLTQWNPFQHLLGRLGWWFLPLLFAGLALAATQIVRRWMRARKLADLDPVDRPLLLFAPALLLVFLFLWIEPQLEHHGYFAHRRLLFTLPLIFIACPLLLRWLWKEGQPKRALALAAMAPLAFLLADFILEFNLKSYYGWEFDSGTKAAVNALRQRHLAEPNRQIILRTNWLLSESLNFYRSVDAITWMPEATRDGPECSADYYFVEDDELGRLNRFGVEEIYRDRRSGTVLAARGREARQRMASLRATGFTGALPCNADVMVDDSWIEIGLPDADRHMLRDFQERSNPNVFRWTYERPALLFYVLKRENARFKMDFLLPSKVFQATGPIRLTVFVNGQKIGERTYDSPERQSFEQAVPPGLLRSGGITLVETVLDKYYRSPDDGQKLGYLFVRGGFLFDSKP